MSTPRNRNQIARMLADVYGLTPEEVRRALDEMSRLKRGEGECVMINANGGTDLTVDRLDFAS